MEELIVWDDGIPSFRECKRVVNKDSKETFLVRTFCKYGELPSPKMKKLLSLEHPHVAKVKSFSSGKWSYWKNVVIEEESIIITSEWFEYRLFDTIDTVDEIKAKEFFRLILDTLSFLEEHGINILPALTESMLLRDKNDISTFALDIFGLDEIDLNYVVARMPTTRRIPIFTAPEEVEGEKRNPNLTTSWYLGVILYRIIGGYFPFTTQIMAGDFDCEGGRWDEFSTEGNDLIESLLCTELDDRLPWHQIETHPWMNSSRQKSAHK